MKKNIHLFLWMLLIVPSLVFSAGEITPGTEAPRTTTIKPVITNPLNSSIGTSIPAIIEAIMRGVVLPLASVLVVLAILYSGFKFVWAQGNAAEIQKARDGLVWVLIGSAILLGSYGIAEFLEATINQVVPTTV